MLFWWSDSSESCESYMLQRAKANILNTFLTFMNLLVRKAWDLSKWRPRLRCLCVFLLTCKRCWIEVPGRAKDVGEAVATCRKSKGVAVLDLCIFWRNAFEAVASALCFHQICFHLRLQLVDPKRLLMPSQTKPGAAFPLRFISGTIGILKGFTLGLDEFVSGSVCVSAEPISFRCGLNSAQACSPTPETSTYPGPDTDEETSNAQSFTEMTTERPKDLKSKCSCIQRATVWLLVRSDLLVKARKRADGTWDSGEWPWIFSVFLEVVINFEQKQLCETYERTVSRWLGFLQPSRQRCSLTGTQGLQLKHG